jgi:hypothetical protein
MQIYRVVREKKQRFEVIVYGIFHREFGECSARFQRPCPGRGACLCSQSAGIPYWKIRVLVPF